MITNPYTGEPLPENQYVPTMLRPAKVNTELAKPQSLTSANMLGSSNSNVGSEAAKATGGLGANLQASAGDILSFGAEQYANFQNTAQSTKESQGQMIGSTMKAASLGMKVGGPLGAGVGAVVGAGLGFMDLKKDQQTRVDEGDKDHRAMLEAKKIERKKSYNMQQGKQVSNVNTGSEQQKYYNPYG